MTGKIKALLIAMLSAVTCFAIAGCSGTSTSSSASSSTDATASEESNALVDSGGMYVSAEWLANNLDQVIVVDARDSESYGATHIKGAVNLTWQEVSHASDIQIGEEGWAELLDDDAIAKAAAKVGIDGSKPVVVYADVAAGWGEDGRIMWTLREAGIKDVSVLDGGWRKWVGSGNATEGGSVVNGTEVSPIDAEDADPIDEVDGDYVKKHLDDAVIVDARTEAEYEGETVVYEARMGRIPNAVNVPDLSLFNQDGTVKTEEELTSILDEAGLTDKDALVITYCTGGVRGANVAEVLSTLGYTNVKVYTAGFAEWAGNDDNKVEAEAAVPEKSAA